jgi:hypothetical protein
VTKMPVHDTLQAPEATNPQGEEKAKNIYYRGLTNPEKPVYLHVVRG